MKNTPWGLAAFLLILSTSAYAHMEEGKSVCASCYWPKRDSCGFITEQQVVSLHLEDHSPDLPDGQQGPFTQFSCNNGRKELGIVWTDKGCGQTGGLSGSGLPIKMFPEISHKPECKFGAPGNEKISNELKMRSSE